MKKFSERSRKSLRGVHPDLIAVITAALQSSPVDFVVIEGLRTMARQRELKARGASKTLNSRHLTGHAVDLMPIDPATGKGSWHWPLYDRLGPAVKAEAKKLGVALEWGGDWTTFRDGPHFQLAWDTYPKDDFVSVIEAPVAPPVKAPQEVPWTARVLEILSALFGGKK